MKILEPKPPPTSGAITRNLCSGAMPTKAAITSRATCGFCDVFQSVKLSLPVSYSPIATRGSIALGTRRLLTMSILVTCLAPRTRRRLSAGRPDAIRRSCSSARSSWICGARFRLGRIGDGRKRLILDRDFLRRVFRLRQRLRDDKRHRIADITDLARRDRRMRRHLHRRAVLGMDHPAADEIADLVGGQLLAGQHRDHARHFFGRLDVDLLDPRMRVRRTQEKAARLARPARCRRCIAPCR